MSFDFPLPEGWCWKTVDQIKAPGRSIVSGPFGSNIGKRFFVEKGVPVIRGNNLSLSMERFSDDGFVFVTDEKAVEFKNCEAKSNDIIFTAAGTIGQVGIIPLKCKFPFYIISNKQLRARLNPEIVHPLFAYYWFASPPMVEFIKNHNTGSTIPLINLSVLRSLPIPLPPLETQRHIVLVLSVLDERISNLRAANSSLESIAQALFKSWFVNFDPVRAKQEGREPEGLDEATAALFPKSFEDTEIGAVPKGWQVVRLGDITVRITKGTTPTTLKRSYVNSGINFIKVESLTPDGGFLINKFAYIDAATHELLKRSQLQVDDVLVTIAGTIGRVAIVTEDILPANTNQAVALIRPNANNLPGIMIKHFLQRVDSQQTMGERVVQAVQANLSLASISDMKVAVPPTEVVDKLCDAGIVQLEALKRQNQSQILTLTDLRDRLLPRLISGQLRLPDAEALVEEAAA